MAEKVVLILIDGARPDALAACGHPFVKPLLEKSAYTLEARTVFPSVTLPCHMSLFLGVSPKRHGILTNTYVPQVRPVNGLFEQNALMHKKQAMFYTWEELRDLERPGMLYKSVFYNQYLQPCTDELVTDEAVKFINEEQPDFVFLYLGKTDSMGHDYGWMGEEYLKAVYVAFDCIQKVCENLPEGYTVMVTADHGGHDQMHGTELPEDMTIPMICMGPRFKPGKLENASILDLAPTIAAMLEVPAADEWEGKVWPIIHEA